MSVLLQPTLPGRRKVQIFTSPTILELSACLGSLLALVEVDRMLHDVLTGRHPKKHYF
jgi:hypothetical protein